MIQPDMRRQRPDATMCCDVWLEFCCSSASPRKVKCEKFKKPMGFVKAVDTAKQARAVITELIAASKAATRELFGARVQFRKRAAKQDQRAAKEKQKEAEVAARNKVAGSGSAFPFGSADAIPGACVFYQ